MDNRQRELEYEKNVGRRHVNRYPDDWHWNYRGGKKDRERLRVLVEHAVRKGEQEAVEESRRLREKAGATAPGEGVKR
jgi:hypothetical protein